MKIVKTDTIPEEAQVRSINWLQPVREAISALKVDESVILDFSDLSPTSKDPVGLLGAQACTTGMICDRRYKTQKTKTGAIVSRLR